MKSASCTCQNGKYLARIMDDLGITCEEIIDYVAEAMLNAEAKSNNKEAKTVSTNLDEKNITYKTQYIYILYLPFS